MVPVNVIFLGLVCLIAAVSGAKQQLIRQCSCQEFNSCKQKILTALPACAEQCQRHLVSLGANYDALKRCVQGQESKLLETLSCLEKKFPNACANGAPKMVQRRYKFGMELALVNELRNTMSQANINTDVGPLIEIGKKFGRCARSCLAKKTDSCMESKKCSYDLPSDTEVVKQGKKCSVEAKFLVPEVIRDLCFCVANAGIKQIAPSCKAISKKQVFFY